jgi:aldehyde dehydrogenase (NAD+)
MPSCDSGIVRRPRGVVACISPGFSPVALPLRQILASLVVGNTVVWKPSDDTPVCAQWLSRLFLEGGIMEGAVNIVHGTGETIGAALAGHRDVDAVLFAGARRTAIEMHKRFGGDLSRTLCLEAGGVGAFIVTAEADLEAAAAAAAVSAFRTSGQRLNSVDRVFVDASAEPRFAELFVAKAKALKIGPGAEPEVTLGPLVSSDAHARWTALRRQVLNEGGDVLLDGGELKEEPYEHGCYASPFVWRSSHAAFGEVAREEARCPHVVIVSVEGVEQAVEAFNASSHGKTLALFSNDSQTIRRVRENACFEQGYVNTAVGASEAQSLAAGQACYGTGQAGLPTVQSAIARDASLLIG